MEDPTDKARPGALRKIQTILFPEGNGLNPPTVVPEHRCEPGLPVTEGIVAVVWALALL